MSSRIATIVNHLLGVYSKLEIIEEIKNELQDAEANQRHSDNWYIPQLIIELQKLCKGAVRTTQLAIAALPVPREQIHTCETDKGSAQIEYQTQSGYVWGLVLVMGGTKFVFTLTNAHKHFPDKYLQLEVSDSQKTTAYSTQTQYPYED